MVADGGDVDFASGRKGGLFVGVDLAGPWCQEVWPETALVQAGRSFARATAAILFEQPALTSKFRAHMDAFAGQTLNADLGAAADLFLLNADTTTPSLRDGDPGLGALSAAVEERFATDGDGRRTGRALASARGGGATSRRLGC